MLATGSGSSGSGGSETGGWAGKKEEKVWTRYVEDSAWKVRNSFALSSTSGWAGRAILVSR